MSKLFPRILYAVALAVIAGLSGAALVGGLLAKAIDGPARGGSDAIYLAERPGAFWAMATVYFVVFCLTALGAYKVLRRK